MYYDRKDAGEKLAGLMDKYKNAKGTIILGLPRGGVVTAAAIAKQLNLPLDITCPRKIGAPSNPELAVGAVTETGFAIFNRSLLAQLGLTEESLKEEVAHETKRAAQRLRIFRQNLPPRQLSGKTVILVDDGLATGATMKAAIESMKKEKVKAIVVAVPVSPKDTYQEIKQLVDEIICLDIPSYFQAVGQFYTHFDQTEDDEVLELLHSGALRKNS